MEKNQTALLKEKTEEILDMVFTSSDPAFYFELVMVVLEMGMKRFLREKEQLCEECKK